MAWVGDPDECLEWVQKVRTQVKIMSDRTVLTQFSVYKRIGFAMGWRCYGWKVSEKIDAHVNLDAFVAREKKQLLAVGWVEGRGI
jgi:hypothetical protein